MDEPVGCCGIQCATCCGTAAFACATAAFFALLRRLDKPALYRLNLWSTHEHMW
jgi:hypothetical protein